MIHMIPSFEKAERFMRIADQTEVLGLAAPDAFDITLEDFSCHECDGTGKPCAGACKGAGTTVENGENKPCKDCKGKANLCDRCDGRGIVGEGGTIRGRKGDMILFDEKMKAFFAVPIRQIEASGLPSNPPSFPFGEQYAAVVQKVESKG